jgi:RND family efflux transporter MFP subunit
MRLPIAAALLLVSLGAAAAETVAINAAQRTALGIATAPAVSVEAGLGARLPARVAVPNAQLQVIAAPQEGLIQALLVAEGETVSAGQVLARIQSPRLVELQSEYLEIRARHELAAGNYRRDQQLFKEGIIAERRLLESRAAQQELASSLARVRHLLTLAGLDEAALEALHTRRGLSASLEVKAPQDGVILQQLAAVGARVAASDPLYQLAQLKPLWLEIHVPLAQAAALRPGQTVRVGEPALSGRIVAIGRNVHGTDQGVLIRAEVHDGAERLHPGQFVQAQIETGAGTASFRVPRAAVFRAQDASYVFVAVAEGFQAIAVRILAEEPEHLLVQGELGAGSEIAVAGVAAIKAAWLEGAE